MTKIVSVDRELPLVVPGDTLYKALTAIDESRLGIALVVASMESRVLLGVITDGDIRRGLIKGSGVDSLCRDVMSVDPLTVKSDSPRELVLAKLEAHSLSAVPILDEKGQVVGLHGLRELVNTTLPNWALIMAGGKGTRLAPLTKQTPKPLVPVAGRPIIERLLLHLIDSGVRNFVISIAYLGEQIRDFLGDGSRYGCNIVYLEEDPDIPLGTAGALALLPQEYPEAVGQSVILLNGDIVTQVDLHSMIQRHEESEADVTLVLRPYAHEVPFGLAEVDESGRVIELVEKPTWRGSINAGVYAVSPSVFSLLTPGEAINATDVVQGAVEAGLSVRAEETVASWQDVGTWSELHKARGNHD